MGWFAPAATTTTTMSQAFGTTTTMSQAFGTPELPGGSLYLLIGGASGMIFWVRRFFRK